MHTRPNCLTIRHKSLHIGAEEYTSLEVAMEQDFEALICRTDCFLGLEPKTIKMVRDQAQKYLNITDFNELRYNHYLTIGFFTQFAKDKNILEIELRSSITDHVRLRFNWTKYFSPVALKLRQKNEQKNR